MTAKNHYQQFHIYQQIASYFKYLLDNSSQIWSGITKFAPNMHHEILSANIENEVIDHDLQSQLRHFDSKVVEIWLFHTIDFNGFELESPNFHQICILGLSQPVLKMSVIDLDLQGHLAISPHNSKTRHSTSLLYTDPGRPRGVTHPKCVLVYMFKCLECGKDNFNHNHINFSNIHS